MELKQTVHKAGEELSHIPRGGLYQNVFRSTVTDQLGDPLEGVNVFFSVAGPNAPIPLFGIVTNSSGEATFGYTGNNAGTDTIQAWTGADTFAAAADDLKDEGTKEWVTRAITINTPDDELNSDGDCSLREAVQAANTDTGVDGCTAGSGADTIKVPPGPTL